MTAALPIRHPKGLQSVEISAGVHRQGAPRSFFPLGSRRVLGFFEDECDCEASQFCWQHWRAPREVQREVKKQLRCSRRNRNPNTGHRKSSFSCFHWAQKSSFSCFPTQQRRQGAESSWRASVAAPSRASHQPKMKQLIRHAGSPAGWIQAFPHPEDNVYICRAQTPSQVQSASCERCCQQQLCPVS